MTKAIVSLHYTRSTIDHCLFDRTKGGITDLLVVYVDDILVMSTGGKTNAEAQLDELHELYGLKKLGVVSHILGMGVHQSDNGTVIEQRSYLENMLEESGFSENKPLSTPWDEHFQGNLDPLEPAAAAMFRRTLGQLMYLSNTTRLDIAFTMGRLASTLKEPNVGDKVRMKRLLKYLCGTPDTGIKYTRMGGKLSIDTYVDEGYGIDTKRGRSITGYVSHIAGGAVAWRSHLQPIVPDSPNAAEYIGLHEAKVFLFIRDFLSICEVIVGLRTVLRIIVGEKSLQLVRRCPYNLPLVCNGFLALFWYFGWGSGGIPAIKCGVSCLNSLRVITRCLHGRFFCYNWVSIVNSRSW